MFLTEVLSKGCTGLLVTFMLVGLAAQKSHMQDTQSPKLIHKSDEEFLLSATKRAEPAYPLFEKLTKIAGTVVVEVIVDTEGTVTSACALSGPPGLRGPAETAARKWSFAPERLNGMPARVIGKLTFDFRTEGAISHDEEIEAKRKEVVANPNSAEAHFELARAYGSQHRELEAIDEYKRALYIKPDLTTAHYNLAEIYDRQGSDRQAVEAYKKAIRFKPDYIDAYYGLGRSYRRLERYGEAITAWKQAVKISNGDPKVAQGAYRGIASIYKEMGRIEDAIEAYKQLIDIEKRLREIEPASSVSPDLYAKSIAYLYIQLGRKDAAIQFYKEAINLASNDTEAAWAYADLADLYKMMRRDQEAVAAFMEVAKRRPDWAKPHFELGLLYVKLGDKRQALDEYKLLESMDAVMAAELRRKIQE